NFMPMIGERNIAISIIRRFMKYLNKIIEYGLYLLVFLLPWQTRWIIKAGEINGGYLEYGTISLYGVDIILIILLILFAFNKFLFCSLSEKKDNENQSEQSSNFAQECRGKISTTWWLIGFLDLFIFISIFFASDRVLAIYRYGVFLLGVGLFWLITSVKYNKVKLIWSLIIGLLIQAMIATWQFIWQADFSSKWLGMAQHQASELGTSVIEIVGLGGVVERWLRAYGGLDHPNILGGVLVVGIFFILILIVKNLKSDGETSRQNLILFSIFCILFTALVFSFSRASWLGIAVGILFLLIFTIIKKDLFLQREVLKIILTGSVLFFLFSNLYSGLFGARLIRGSNRLEIKSSIERSEGYSESWEIIKSNWVTGVGIGNYTLAVSKKTIEKKAWDYQPAHNIFLLVWAEIGILGFLVWLGLLGWLGWEIIKRKRAIYFAIFLSIIIMMMFDHWWWSLHFGVLFFWLVASLLIKNNGKIKQ
ncbi:MAG: O-antigen ligase family protein, partial [Patescibacteria group bacterium]